MSIVQAKKALVNKKLHNLRMLLVLMIAPLMKTRLKKLFKNNRVRIHASVTELYYCRCSVVCVWLTRRDGGGGGGGGGYSQKKKNGGFVRPASWNPYPIFQTKICDFPNPISDLTKSLIPYSSCYTVGVIIWEGLCWRSYRLIMTKTFLPKKHTQFKTWVNKPYPILNQLVKIDNLFQIKTAKKPDPLGPHLPI